MSDYIFRIKNLECSYPVQGTVFKVNSLEIPGEKLIVLLGISGAGKSTVLETLGLMNDTIVNNSEIIFRPDSKEISYRELWKKKTRKDIAQIRNLHFSFIFQDTNLMPNFTCYENVCIVNLIQGKTKEESLDKAGRMMKKLGLEEIDLKTMPAELSGGQKQRLAFVRAITPEFTLLFGDEPTGNLDENNSRELMQILKDIVVFNKKTAIIVSHNIELAVKFADQIIVLTKTNEFGEILEKNIFNCTKNNGKYIWQDLEKNTIDNMQIRIRKILNNEEK